MSYNVGIRADTEIVWTKAIQGDSYGDAALFVAIKQLRELGATEDEITMLCDHLHESYGNGDTLDILTNQTITAHAGGFSIAIAHA